MAASVEELKVAKELEASEQSKRVRITAGAAAIGGGLCFILPVVGGVTLACVGAAAAAAATTRADEAGEAARASGAAVAAGFQRVSELEVSKKAKKLYTSTKDRLGGTPSEPREEPTWWERLRTPRVNRLEVYGAHKTPADVATAMLREVSAPPTVEKRRRLALEIIRELHPDRAGSSIANKATASALTTIAVNVRDFLDEKGWDCFDTSRFDNIAAELKKRL